MRSPIPIILLSTPQVGAFAQLSNEEWVKLLNLIQVFSQQMVHSIEGNHFLLVGQKRVRQIVQTIEKAEKIVPDFLDALRDFFPHQKFRTTYN